MFKPSLEVLEDRTMPSSGISNTVPINPGQVIAQTSITVSKFVEVSVAIANQAIAEAQAAFNQLSNLFPSSTALGQQDFLIFIDRTREVTKTVSITRES